MTTEKTANQRGAARLAAVQALYQMDLAGTALADVLAEYEVYRLGKEIDGDVYLKADPAWFRAIVTGVVKDQKMLDPKISDAISEGWTLARLDSTLRAILRAGVFEITKKPDVPTAVIVTEYVEIATAFFEGDEGKLVNAVLDRIARRERGEKKA